MLKGQVQVGPVNEMSSGQVLTPSDVVDSNGKMVFDVLHDKHPDPQPVRESLLVSHGDPLPPMVDIDITGDHIEFVARRIQALWNGF